MDAQIESDPQFETAAEAIWQSAIDPSANLAIVVSNAEVPADDDFVLEVVSSVNEVVEVHVSMLVDLVLLMFGGQEGHLGDENFGPVHVGACIQASGRSVAGVRDHRDSDLVCNFRSR
jgi:hypothetical protein